MADGGQGFFKICMSVLPHNYSSDLDCMDDDSTEESDYSKSEKRTKYSDGGTSSKTRKLSSVHRAILLYYCPYSVKETYQNIKHLFELTSINNIPFKFVSDFKLILIVNGLQTASVSYPSPYCFVTLKSLRDRSHHNIINDDQDDDGEVNNNMNISDTCMKLRTYGDLKESYGRFRALGHKKKFAKDCHSTINAALFQEDDSTFVIEKCVIPELHILQGVVNHLFWDGLVPLVGREQASKNYQGDVFEGNACRRLLKEADRLLDEDVLGHRKLEIWPLVTTFKSFNKVVSDCFSAKRKVGPDLSGHIDEFKKMFVAANVSETLKLHVALQHNQHKLRFLNNTGLGLSSEQPGESIHRDFLKYWNRYKMNNLTDSRYGIQLHKAVLNFSSTNL